MLLKQSTGLAALALITVTCAQPCQAASQKRQAATASQHKSSAKRHHSRRSHAIRHGKSYLVPPPPPYSPSILPELMYARAHSIKKKTAEEPQKTAENSNTKTIWSREGYEDPEPVQPNKYVTYWNKN